jgi:hypothetical protein
LSEITGTERAASARLAGAVTDHVDRSTAEDRQREAERRQRRADSADRSEVAEGNLGARSGKESSAANNERGQGHGITRQRGVGNNVDFMA